MKKHPQDGRDLEIARLLFQRLYNEQGIMQRRGWKTPAQGRREQLQVLPLAA